MRYSAYTYAYAMQTKTDTPNATLAAAERNGTSSRLDTSPAANTSRLGTASLMFACNAPDVTYLARASNGFLARVLTASSKAELQRLCEEQESYVQSLRRSIRLLSTSISQPLISSCGNLLQLSEAEVTELHELRLARLDLLRSQEPMIVRNDLDRMSYRLYELTGYEPYLLGISAANIQKFKEKAEA